MEDKHPIDRLFRERLADPDIPFDEKDWNAVAKKIRPSDKRKARLLSWFGIGTAAAAAIAAVVLVSDRHTATDGTPTSASTAQPQADTRPRDPIAVPGEHGEETVELPETEPRIPTSATLHEPAMPPADAKQRGRTNHQRIATAVPQSIPATALSRPPGFDGRISLARAVPPSASSPVATIGTPSESTATDLSNRGWAFSILAAPDLSGTRPLGGRLSGNIGLLASYRLNGWLTVSTGALYAQKRYETPFAAYKPRLRWENRAGTPLFVEADCGVLDIPFNIGIDVRRRRQSSWFIAAGVSSYLMLRESYVYHYPQYEYGYPKAFTLRNENRHILGVGNLSMGYRSQVGPTIGLTVQPFVKVPLTGIGNGTLRLYSTGVAVSADIDLTRRTDRSQ